MSDQSLQAICWDYAIERGPDWLFVRLQPGEGQPQEEMAGDIWNLMGQHLVNRVVLEMDEVEQLNSLLVGQLVLLHKCVHAKGGIMRLSGLRQDNQQVLRMFQLEDRFPRYVLRDDAVRGSVPTKPR